MPRPKLYENDAARQAAYREKNSRVDLVIEKQLNETLSEISGILDVTKNALITSMIKFALTNHNWKKSGVWLKSK
jgi:hypothetical protein